MSKRTSHTGVQRMAEAGYLLFQGTFQFVLLLVSLLELGEGPGQEILEGGE